MTLDDLVLMMQRVFQNRLKPSDDITLKYQDEGLHCFMFKYEMLLLVLELLFHKLCF